MAGARPHTAHSSLSGGAHVRSPSSSVRDSVQGQWGWFMGGHGQLPSLDAVLALRCPVHPRWPPAAAKGCCQLRPCACPSLSAPLSRGSALTCCSAALCGPAERLGWLAREQGSWSWELLFAIADAPVGPAASPSWKQPPGRRELTPTTQDGGGQYSMS